MQIKVESIDYPTHQPTLPLNVCVAHRNGKPNQTTNPPFGLDDLPCRVTGEYHQSPGGTVREWHPRACEYELRELMTWGSWKAQRAGRAVHDEVEFGWRVALTLDDQRESKCSAFT